MDKGSKVARKGGKPLMLSPRFTEKHWEDAFDGHEEWDAAINIVEDRIKGRWLDAADRLLVEPYAGFAILAIDCIILESLWGFMNGQAFPRLREAQAYQDILTGPHFGWTPSQSEDFRNLVRNGVMHDAETRSRWLVRKTVPRDAIVRKNKDGNCELNRTKFHNALKAAFKDWVAKLRSGDAALRGRMRQRMNEMIAKHYAP
jgi:hypothetical protein